MSWHFDRGDHIEIRRLKPEELAFHALEPDLPLVISSTSSGSFRSLGEFVDGNVSQIRAAVTRSGAVLLRNFAVESPEQFESVLTRLKYPLSRDYVLGMAPRTNVFSNVFTSTEARNDAPIPPHTEICYLATRPKMLSFFCAVEPALYGETPLSNLRSVYQNLDPEVRNALETKGLMYVRNLKSKKSSSDMGVGRTIRDTFGTDSKDEIEALCRKFDTRFEWVAPDHIRTETVLPAVVEHPDTGEKSLALQLTHWRNGMKNLEFLRSRQGFVRNYSLRAALLFFTATKRFPMSICFGDGEPIGPRVADELHKAVWKHSVVFRWRKGDVLIIDNILTSHARLNVVPPRRVLACFGDMYTVPARRDPALSLPQPAAR